MEMDANSKKAMHFISLIKQYQELAVTVRDADEFLKKESRNYLGAWGRRSE